MKRKRVSLASSIDNNDRDENDNDEDEDQDDDNEEQDKGKEELELSEREYCLRQFLHERFQALGPAAIDLLKEIVTESESQHSTKPSLRGIERFFARMSWCDDEVIYWKIVEAGKKNEKNEKDENTNPRFDVIPIHVFDAQRRIRSMWQQRYLDPFGRRVPTNLWNFRSTVCQAVCIGWMIQYGLLARLQYLEQHHPVSLQSYSGQEQSTKPSTTASRLKGKSHDSCVFEYPITLCNPPAIDDIVNVPIMVTSIDATRDYYRHLVSRRCSVQTSTLRRDDEETAHLFASATWDVSLSLPVPVYIPPILQPEIVTFATVNAADEEQLKQMFNVKHTRPNGPKPRYNSRGQLIMETNECKYLHIPLVSPALSMKTVTKLAKGMSKKHARALHLANVQRFYWDRRDDFNAETGLPAFFDIPRDALLRPRNSSSSSSKSNSREEKQNQNQAIPLSAFTATNKDEGIYQASEETTLCDDQFME